MSGAVDVGIVLTDAVGDVWPQAAPLLAKAVDRTGGRYTLETVRKSLECGEQQLFLASLDGDVIGAATTRLAEYPNDLRLIVVHCGGTRLDLWLSDGMAAIEDWAVRNGCTAIEVKGRREWARLLGMKITGYTMERACG